MPHQTEAINNSSNENEIHQQVVYEKIKASKVHTKQHYIANPQLYSSS